MSEEYKELRLKDVILYFLDIIKYLKSKFFYILGIGLLSFAFFAYNASKSKSMYSEKLTFMMDEKTGNEIPGLDLLGNLFGKGGGSDNNFGKILELFESKRIIHNTFFTKINVKGKNDFLVNHLIDFYGLNRLIDDHKKYGLIDSWAEGLRNSNLKFSNSVIDSFSNDEGLLLQLCYEKINGNPNSGLEPLLTSDFNVESGIMTITMKSESQEITLAVLNNVYEQLSEFFIDRTIEKQQKTFNIVKAKKDSIEYALKRKEFSLADFKDRNRNLVTVKGYLDQARLEREVQVLGLMYAEIIKHYETTDFSLKNKTPVVQIIDKPRSPILPSKPSSISKGIFGFIIGSVLASLLFFISFQYKKVMTS